jgi:HPr kinase/phosphorylase
MGPALTLADLFESKKASLALEFLNPEVPLTRTCRDPDISSPGLALSGFLERFHDGRMQVFGETEMTYLASLEPGTLQERLQGFFAREVPAAFVTKGLDVPDVMLEVATENGVPLFRSPLSTRDFFRRLKPHLEVVLAPSTTVHGSLADVYGVGLLFMGKSGIGKSECVLDLVERGHRLVADDLIIVSRRGVDVLIGRGHELQRHHMEIRGIGIVDIGALFGIRAIRQQKRIEVVVQLEEWDDARSYDRTGLDREDVEILGVRLPRVTVPLNPGKNITVISEVVAMNHLLKVVGVDSAADFEQRLQGVMAGGVRAYLDEDYE